MVSVESFIIGDYSARAFEFRLLLASTDTNVTPNVSILEVSIDMPDRSYGQNDLVAGTTGLTVTYSPAFKASPALAISAQGLQTGDYYVMTSKSATGFTIIFRDSAAACGITNIRLFSQRLWLRYIEAQMTQSVFSNN